jgi:Fe-S-cluster containining protein
MAQVYNCSKCGACCKMVGRAIAGLKRIEDEITHPAEKLFLHFPFGFKEDNSTCEKYDEKIGCTIYETRPDICRMDTIQLVYKRHSGMSFSTYYSLSAMACNAMMNMLDIPLEFRILPGHELRDIE